MTANHSSNVPNSLTPLRSMPPLLIYLFCSLFHSFFRRKKSNPDLKFSKPELKKKTGKAKPDDSPSSDSGEDTGKKWQKSDESGDTESFSSLLPPKDITKSKCVYLFCSHLHASICSLFVCILISDSFRVTHWLILCGEIPNE